MTARKPIKKVSEKQKKRNVKLSKIKPPKDGLCEICGKPPDFRGLARAHKKRRSDGTNDKRSNIVWACYPCHNGDNWKGGHKTEAKKKPGTILPKGYIAGWGHGQACPK